MRTRGPHALSGLAPIPRPPYREPQGPVGQRAAALARAARAPKPESDKGP